MDPRGFPTNLPEFQQVFPDDAAGAKYLETMRWPNGFTCPRCGQTGEPYRFPTRSSVVLRCRKCKVNTSLIARGVSENGNTALVASSSGQRNVFWCDREASQPERLCTKGQNYSLNNF
jgi:hypothetical protein